MSLKRTVAAAELTPADLMRGGVFELSAEDRVRLGVRLTEQFDGDTDTMLAEAWLMGATALWNANHARRICRICGCWELGACHPPCRWVAEDLCSACTEQDDG
jgi:hypothetical protein